MTVVLKDSLSSLRTFPTAKLKLPIDMTNCAAIFLPGADATRPYRNWLDGSSFTTFGAPTADDSSVVFGGDGVSYAQTSAADHTELTLFSVSAPILDLNAALIGNWGSNSTSGGASPVTVGATLWANHDVNSDSLWKPGTSITKSDNSQNTFYGATAQPINVAKALAMRHSVTSGRQQIDNLTISQQNAATGIASRNLGQTFRLGASYGVSFPNASQHWVDIIFRRYITDEELADLYAWAKAFCAALPTPVTV